MKNLKVQKVFCQKLYLMKNEHPICSRLYCLHENLLSRDCFQRDLHSRSLERSSSRSKDGSRSHSILPSRSNHPSHSSLRNSLPSRGSGHTKDRTKSTTKDRFRNSRSTMDRKYRRTNRYGMDNSNEQNGKPNPC